MTNEEKKLALDVLWYELDMFNWTSKYRENSAYLESFLLHTRNIVDFLEDNKNKHKSDITCSDFGIKKNNVNLPPNNTKKEINLWLSHITKERMEEKKKPGWGNLTIRKEVNRCFGIFLDQLPQNCFPSKGGEKKSDFEYLLTEVVLVPIRPEEKEEFYKLATESEGSKFWYGDRGVDIPTKDDFFEDWNESYFDIISPEKGQCFWIIVDGEKIGQVNYNKIDLENKKVELDIIVGDEAKMGKGYGADALKTLINYLFDNFDVNKIWIEPRANNPRAIRAYEKAGFRKKESLADRVRFEILKSEL